MEVDTHYSDKILEERETRKKLLAHARLLGREREMLMCFAKYDKMLKNCTNKKEYEDMAKLGCYEMYQILGGGGELYVNGSLVAKG